jgi:N6-L-threonylcarbamoyladenine synthase
MREHGDHRLIGRTRDDAAGEVFDKVARVLGLGFPGGPAIEGLIDDFGNGHLMPFHLPQARLEGTYDFSFSGLKTAVYRAKAGKLGPTETKRIFKDGGQIAFERGDSSAHVRMAAGFQRAIVDVLVAKTAAAVEEFEANSVIVAGGVAANRLLRAKMQAAVAAPLHLPEIRLCTDNGAMVAMAGSLMLQRGEIASPDLDVNPGLRLASEDVPA